MKTLWKIIKWYFIVTILIQVLRLIYLFDKIISLVILVVLIIFLVIYFKPKRYREVNINSMSGIEFENFLERMFKNMNYKVKRTPITNDMGADLILNKKSDRIVVQAKRYSKPVGNKAVQEVLSAKAYYDCNKAIVVTNNTFTKSAKELARKTGVKLWNGKFLHKLS